MIPARVRWTLCVLLFLATTLNYLDRQTLAVLAPLIQQEFGFGNQELGLLFSAFYYSYTIAQFLVGGLLDRSHVRWAYGLGVLAWSAVGALTALAAGFRALLSFRILLGLTESVNWPAAMRIVARSLPPEERALGNGIFTSGTSIGALIAPLLILGIANWLGWRAGFLIVGLLGAIWFVAWSLFTRNRTLDPVWRRQAEEPSPGPALAAYAEVLKSPRFWRVSVVTILVNPCLYFNLNWLPTYFVQERNLAAGMGLGGLLTVIYLGLDLGYLSSGAAALWLAKRNWPVSRARRIVFLTATVLLALTAAVPLAPTVETAVAILFFTNAGAGAWIAMYLTMAQEVSTTHVSTAAGMLGGSGSLAGALAMYAVGKVTGETGSFFLPMVAVGIASILAAAAGMAVERGRASSSEAPAL